MKKKLLYYFLIFSIVLSCSRQGAKENTVIFGNFTELKSGWIYLEELEVKGINPVDSIQIDNNGNFHFEWNVNEPGFYIVKTDQDNYALFLVKSGDQIEIKVPNSLYQLDYKVIGSADSKYLLEFEVFMTTQKDRVDSLANVLDESRGSEEFYSLKQELDLIYLQIFDDQRKYMVEFIDKHAGSLTSLIVLNRKLGNRVVLDEENDYIYYHKIDSALMVNYPENKHAIDHHNRVQQIKGRVFDNFVADKKLEPGNKAPNIVLKDTSGQYISLKDLGGQKILIYFWAGWNAKSRQDNRKLVSLYPQFKASGLEILGVSFDENEKVWEGALKLDELPWINGSELKGLNSKVKKDYNIADELPYYYIVDENRMILYRDKDLQNILIKIEEII